MNYRRMKTVAFLLAAASAWIGPSPIHASSMSKPLNLAALVKASPEIVTGVVSKVSQGRIGNTPCTEVEVTVDRTIRGQARETITLRQLNLQSNGPSENGRLYLGSAPGMPQYTVGEQVLLFLGKKGLSGFRTTIGFAQGKFTIQGGNAQNDFGNRGLFKDLTLNRNTSLDTRQTAMLATTQGVVSAGTFIGLLERAVTENWWGAPAATPPSGGSGGSGGVKSPPVVKGQ